jgi:hypothetical protein
MMTEIGRVDVLAAGKVLANGKSVETCAGNGIRCNTANLIIYHRWTGLLVDGDESLVEQGRRFYRRNPNTFVYPPTLVHAWITRGNVNDVIRDNGFEGQVDLLSIDMDGVDYRIWGAINIIDPRVVVVEYQDIIGPALAFTVPCRDDFNAYEYPVTSGMLNLLWRVAACICEVGGKEGLSAGRVQSVRLQRLLHRESSRRERDSRHSCPGVFQAPESHLGHERAVSDRETHALDGGVATGGGAGTRGGRRAGEKRV